MLFLVLAGIVVGAVAFYAATRPKLYAATATVMVEPHQPNVTGVQPVLPELGGNSSAVDTEVEILTSRRLAGRVADRLSLDEQPEFGGAGAEPLKTVPPAAPGTHPLANALLSHVDVRRVGLTYLIQINAQARDPVLAARIANGFVDEYIAQQEQDKAGTALHARQFLQGRLGRLRTQAASADAALQKYKIENGLMSAQGATLAEQEVSALNQEIAQAQADLAEKTGQLQAARSLLARGGGGADVPATLQSGTVGELRRKEADLSGRVAELDARYGSDHPELRRARDELADTRQELKKQIRRVLTSVAATVQAAQSRVESLNASRARASESLASSNSAQVRYLDLERSAQAARAIYEAFLNRTREMISQEGLERPDARVEAYARVPSRPFSPDYRLAGLFAVFAGILVGFGGVAAAEYVDSRLRTREDVEDRLGLVYLGAIPDLATLASKPHRSEAPHDYVVSHPTSAFAEAFRSLRAVLMSGRTGPQVLVITSALPREGKSTPAMAFARTTALAGRRTVLVDCDARRRSASEVMLPDDWTGLLGLIDGSKTLEAALWHDGATGLAVLGSRVAPPGADLFGNGALDRLLDQLRANFDVIIIDTAPVLGVAETRSVAEAADATILLARWRRTTVRAADTAIDLLTSAGADVRGMLLTLVDVRKHASTGEGDAVHYRSKFRGYYSD